MPLFQKTVENKYIELLNDKVVSGAYEKYKAYFLNPEIQNNIFNANEEQYQSEFLIALFENILGYTMFPKPAYNIITEVKNETDSRKADGTIFQGDKAVVVIELKGTYIKDLDSITTQAFNYKNNHAGCKYIVSSNFEKLRFFIEDATEKNEFNLFTLKYEEFKLLWLCLHKENIFSNLPLKIKQESLKVEKDVTEQLYKDYSAFKKALCEDTINNNPQFTRLELYKKTQKLLDRFLFIFFAEDKGLLTPNTTQKAIIGKWQDLKKLDEPRPLYERIKKYFGYLNTGYKQDNEEIFAYNGGLFLPDEILDNLTINDEVLRTHLVKLSDYNFATEVDVNILGHIFEHSLNDVDAIIAESEGKQLEKEKTRRKKDGIFYTPKYITKYIVDNTVGKLCAQKKSELEIKDEDYGGGKKKKDKKILNDKLAQYRQWLLSLTILDPACGSGAFLNQALEFLITEHRKIDELTSKLFETPLVLSDIENQILENNIYGVDLNEEGVEIAKLSLWLRTAKKGRKLSSLNNKIKCGNSLIDDKNIIGEKAFNWWEEFPEVHAKGGFDVVIGNPPYVNANDLKKNFSKAEYDFLKKGYITAQGTVDLYIYFFEKGLNLINDNGILSFITPNRFLSASYGKGLREFILNSYEISALVDYSDKNVFPDASTYPVISFLKNRTMPDYNVLTGKFDDITKEFFGKDFPSSKLNILEDSILGFLLNDKLEISEKIILQAQSLSHVGEINATSTAAEAELYSTLINESEGYKLINTGTIDPYSTTWGIDYLTDKGQKFLNPYLPKDTKTISKNRHSLYSSPKIIISKIGLQCEAFYDKSGEFSSINTNCIHSFSKEFLPEYVVCWLNSKLYNYLFECFFDGLRMAGGYLLYSAPNLRNTYIKQISIEEQQPFIDSADKMLSMNNELYTFQSQFLTLLDSKLDISNPSNKLKSWHNLDVKSFSKELTKAGIAISLEEENKWLEYFTKQRQKMNAIKLDIENTENYINKIIYAIYGLTQNEIDIVNAS